MYFNVNLKLLTKLINSAFVGVLTGYIAHNFHSCNQHMHTIVILFTIIICKTLNSYMLQTLLVHQ